MVNQKEMQKLNELADLIKEHKDGLTSVALCMKSSLSIATFNKYRPFLTELFADQIEHNGQAWVVKK